MPLERVFHIIKQARTDSFQDLKKILTSGFEGRGESGMEYGRANVIVESSLSYFDKVSLLYRLGDPSKETGKWNDCYALEMEVNTFGWAEKKNWRAVNKVSTDKIKLLHVRLPFEINKKETLKRIEFYKKLAKRMDVEVVISKTPAAIHYGNKISPEKAELKTFLPIKSSLP